MPDYKKISLLFACLFLATWLGVLYNDFLLWDDALYVTQNSQIQNFSLEQALWFLNHFSIANWHPLTLYSHALDYSLFQQNPFGHHLHNLLLHLLNSLLVFFFSRRLFQILQQPAASYIALIAALGFALHPQHVEAVAWVSERKELLSFAFLISAAWAWLQYRQQQLIKFYFISLFLFALALMSKPMAVTFPALLILLDILLLKQIKLKIKTLLLDKIPFFGLSALLIIATLLAQQQIGAISSLERLDLASRLLNSAYNTWFYLEKWLLPVNLSPYYPYRSDLWENPQYSLGILFSLSLSLFALWQWRRKQTAYLLLWLSYLIALSPVIGLIQVGTQAAADRYAYLPTLGFYLGASYLAVQAYQQHKKRLWLAILGIFLLLSWSQLTRQQIKVWHDERQIWQYVLSYYPQSSVAYINLGTAYFEQKNYRAAINCYHQAIKLKPERLRSYNRLATIYVHAGNIPAAIQSYLQLIKQTQLLHYSSPGLADVYYHLAVLYQQQQQTTAADAAIKTALDYDPTHQGALQLRNKP